jgi:MFS family permease
MTSTVQTLSEQEVPLLSEADSHHDDSPADDEPKPSPHNHVFTLCLIITALVQGANFLLISPLTQLKEVSVCRSYYGPGWSLGRDCNVEPVQNGLATLIGWQQLFDYLPGILLGIFYGIIADRYGRRPVLALALTGLTVGIAWTQVVCTLRLSSPQLCTT